MTTDTEKTSDQLAAEAASAEAAALEAHFQRVQMDPAVVSRAGIANGMDPEVIRARILAVAPL
jgi:hypothetical protein